MGPLTSSYVLCGSREANEGKLFELTGELTLTLSLFDWKAGGLSPLLKIPFIRVILGCRDALVRPTTIL